MTLAIPADRHLRGPEAVELGGIFEHRQLNQATCPRTGGDLVGASNHRCREWSVQEGCSQAAISPPPDEVSGITPPMSGNTGDRDLMRSSPPPAAYEVIMRAEVRSLVRDLRAARQRKGMTLSELARRVHVAPSTASRWETGRRRPHSSQLPILADALGVTLPECARLCAHAPPLATEAIRTGRGLALLRQGHGMSRAELAKRLGVARSTVSHWECGRRSAPLTRLQQLAHMLDLPLAEVIRAARRHPPQRVGALAQLRLRAGLTQQQVARQIERSYGSVSAWERGVRCPSWPDVRRLAATYGVSPVTIARAAGLEAPAYLDQRRWTGDRLSRVIRDLRSWTGMTRTVLAIAVGVRPQTITRWEAAQTRPTLQQLRRLEAAFGLPPNALPSPSSRGEHVPAGAG
jgi:transcriptional regulator with XRE-family HTH domain